MSFDELLTAWFPTVGVILAFSGVVRLIVRKKTGAWKEGGAAALAGGIIAGALLSYWIRLDQILLDRGVQDGGWFPLLVVFGAGLVFGFGRAVQRCVRNKAGKWKEGGASLLAGGMITGVSLVGAVLFPGEIEYSSLRAVVFEYLLLPGLVLAFSGAVQLCVRKKTGPWEEGGASLLVGVILVAGTILFERWFGQWGFGWGWLSVMWSSSSIAGLVLLFNGVADLPQE